MSCSSSHPVKENDDSVQNRLFVQGIEPVSYIPDADDIPGIGRIILEFLP
jgi:hypothetical protein